MVYDPQACGLISFYPFSQLPTVRLVVKSTTAPTTLNKAAGTVVPNVCLSRKYPTVPIDLIYALSRS